eukprot:TRINITY_DN349_c0_g3_i1.p1 TRINITY_DN349_c0_g3~~TRINITY_DN349_c0_g3_i1.p1  ORF type:complete len:173 (+),score=21.22 TRINITY_DN349_c0_g3_i1:301-819(+)
MMAAPPPRGGDFVDFIVVRPRLGLATLAKPEDKDVTDEPEDTRTGQTEVSSARNWVAFNLMLTNTTSNCRTELRKLLFPLKDIIRGACAKFRPRAVGCRIKVEIQCAEEDLPLVMHHLESNAHEMDGTCNNFAAEVAQAKASDFVLGNRHVRSFRFEPYSGSRDADAHSQHT